MNSVLKVEPWTDAGVFWCNAHNQRATHFYRRTDGTIVHCCDSDEGGLAVPCDVVDLSGIVESLQPADPIRRPTL